MTAQQKLQQLQEELNTLEKEVGDVQEVLNECRRGRDQTFAYTNNYPDEQEFQFTGKVNGVEISVMINESTLVSWLDSNPKVDELRQARVKMKKVEELLGDNDNE